MTQRILSSCTSSWSLNGYFGMISFMYYIYIIGPQLCLTREERKERQRNADDSGEDGIEERRKRRNCPHFVLSWDFTFETIKEKKERMVNETKDEVIGLRNSVQFSDPLLSSLHSLLIPFPAISFLPSHHHLSLFPFLL